METIGPSESSGFDVAAKLAAYAFFAMGGLTILGGIVLVFQDPAGFAVVAFGLGFVIAGRFALRIARATSGMRAVHRTEYEVGTRSARGQRGIRRAAQVVYLDEAAAADLPKDPRDAWLHLVRDRRPDWVAGRIVAEDERHGRWLDITAVVWSVFALGAVGAAYRWGGVATIVALGVVLTAGAFVAGAVRRRWHERKFGASILALDQVPAVLGEVVTGRIETGVSPRDVPWEGFRVTLQCVHRWREYVRRPGDRQERTHYHRDVLWEADQVSAGEPDQHRGAVSVPVRFALPADQPASTLFRSEEGIAWEIAVTAAMDGLDYRALFEIPVVVRSVSQPAP